MIRRPLRLSIKTTNLEQTKTVQWLAEIAAFRIDCRHADKNLQGRPNTAPFFIAITLTILVFSSAGAVLSSSFH